MSKTKNKIVIDDVEYIRADSVKSYDKADDLSGMPYKLIRTKSAGVFVGYVEEEEDQTFVLRSARRIWYWSGAASLSQLAMDGVKNVSECKFPKEVDRVKLFEVIEVLDVTKEAKKSIDSVLEWTA